MFYWMLCEAAVEGFLEEDLGGDGVAALGVAACVVEPRRVETGRRLDRGEGFVNASHGQTRGALETFPETPHALRRRAHRAVLETEGLAEDQKLDRLAPGDVGDAVGGTAVRFPLEGGQGKGEAGTRIGDREADPSFAEIDA